MARKKKTTKKETAPEKVAVVEEKLDVVEEKVKEKVVEKAPEEPKKAPEKAEVKKEVPKPKPVPKPPEDGKYTVVEVARKHIESFRELWVAGINAFAKSQGFPEKATEAECKALLIKWGGRFKK